jgi:hypothetical protein
MFSSRPQGHYTNLMDAFHNILIFRFEEDACTPALCTYIFPFLFLYFFFFFLKTVRKWGGLDKTRRSLALPGWLSFCLCFVLFVGLVAC